MNEKPVIEKWELPSLSDIYTEMRNSQNRVLSIANALEVDTSKGYKRGYWVTNDNLDGYNAFRNAYQKLRRYILECKKNDVCENENIVEANRLNNIVQKHAKRVEAIALEKGFDIDMLEKENKLEPVKNQLRDLQNRVEVVFVDNPDMRKSFQTGWRERFGGAWSGVLNGDLDNWNTLAIPTLIKEVEHYEQLAKSRQKPTGGTSVLTDELNEKSTNVKPEEMTDTIENTDVDVYSKIRNRYVQVKEKIGKSVDLDVTRKETPEYKSYQRLIQKIEPLMKDKESINQNFSLIQALMGMLETEAEKIDNTKPLILRDDQRVHDDVINSETDPLILRDDQRVDNPTVNTKPEWMKREAERVSEGKRFSIDKNGEYNLDADPGRIDVHSSKNSPKQMQNREEQDVVSEYEIAQGEKQREFEQAGKKHVAQSKETPKQKSTESSTGETESSHEDSENAEPEEKKTGWWNKTFRSQKREEKENTQEPPDTPKTVVDDVELEAPDEMETRLRKKWGIGKKTEDLNQQPDVADKDAIAHDREMNGSEFETLRRQNKKLEKKLKKQQQQQPPVVVNVNNNNNLGGNQNIESTLTGVSQNVGGMNTPEPNRIPSSSSMPSGPVSPRLEDDESLKNIEDKVEILPKTEESLEESTSEEKLKEKKVKAIESVNGRHDVLLSGVSFPGSGFDAEQQEHIKSVVLVSVEKVLAVLNNPDADDSAVDDAMAQWEAFILEKGQLLSDHFDEIRTARDAEKLVTRNDALATAFEFPDDVSHIFMTGNDAKKLKTESEFDAEHVDDEGNTQSFEKKAEVPETEYEKALSNWKKSKEHLANMTDGFLDPATGEHVEGYMSGANQAQMKSIAQELENSGALGRFFSRNKREKYTNLKDDQKALEGREERYREAKELYFKSLHTVLNERKARGNEEKGFDDYRATVGSHFFAKQGDAGYREDVAGRDLRSYHDKEQAFNESMLPERKKGILGSIKSKWNEMSDGKKALFAGGIAAGAVALNGLNPTRILTAMIAGTLMRKVLNAGAFSDERFKERFAKKVEEQRGKYDSARITATSNISPENFKAMEENLHKEFTTIDIIKRENENKMAAVSVAKTVAAAGVGFVAGSQVETDVIGNAIKGMFAYDTPAPGMDTGTPLSEAVLPAGMDSGTPLTEAELPPIPNETPPPSAESVAEPSLTETEPEAGAHSGDAEPVPDAVVEPVPAEPVMESRTITETISAPAPEQYVVIPEQFGGTDTLSETMYENFKAGNLEGLPDGMSRTEFLNKMYASLGELKGNDRILELMSVDGHPPLENFNLVYKDATYDIQPLIDHMNGVPLDQIESGVRESLVTRTVDVPVGGGGYVVPPEGAGSVLEGIHTPEVPTPSVESAVVTPSAESSFSSPGVGGAESVIEGIPTSEVAPSPTESVVTTSPTETVSPSGGTDSVLEGVTTPAVDSVSDVPVNSAGASSVLEGSGGADSVINGVTATGVAESVAATSVMNEVPSSHAMLESLGFNNSQIDTITAEANSRYTDGMTPAEQMTVLENITQRDMLSARLDTVAGVSPEHGMKLMFDMDPNNLAEAISQGTLESVLEAHGVSNPGFYTPIIAELQRTGLLSNGASFAEVLENAMGSRQIEVVTTLLGEDKIRIGAGGLFGNAKTINL